MDVTLVEVITGGIVTVVTSLGTAIISRKYYRAEVLVVKGEIEGIEEEVVVLKNELSFRDEALSFPLEPWQFMQLEMLLDRVMQKGSGEIDRFFVLKAFNGVDEPKWTTAILSIVDGKYVKYDYVRFPLDDHYKDLLKRIRAGENVLLDVDQMVRSALKTVYQSEEIVSSLISHVIDILLSDQRTVSITYASFASHNYVLSETVQMQCTLIANTLTDWAISNEAKRRIVMGSN